MLIIKKEKLLFFVYLMKLIYFLIKNITFYQIIKFGLYDK